MGKPVHSYPKVNGKPVPEWLLNNIERFHLDDMLDPSEVVSRYRAKGAAGFKYYHMLDTVAYAVLYTYNSQNIEELGGINDYLLAIGQKVVELHLDDEVVICDEPVCLFCFGNKVLESFVTTCQIMS